jgi:hypothetical protein
LAADQVGLDAALFAGHTPVFCSLTRTSSARARLTEEVTKSQEVSSETDRKNLLDGIELLLAQAERPAAERQRVNASLILA